MFGFILLFCDLDVLDITSSENNVVEFLLRRRDKAVDLAVFGAKRKDILEGYCRLFRIDLVQGA